MRHLRSSASLALLALIVLLPGPPLWAQGGPPGARVTAIAQALRVDTRTYAATTNGFFRSDDSGVSWEPFNNGLVNTTLTGIAEAPGFLFVTSDGGGVYRSRDEGLLWEAVNTGLPVLNTLSFEVDPQMPSTVYVGLLDLGVFKSTDSGENWTAARAGIVAGGEITDIEVDPANSNIVYAGHRASSVFLQSFVFRSTDGGALWTTIPSQPVFDIAFDPTNSQNIYVATEIGVFRSTNGGGAFTGPQPAGFRVRKLAIDPDTPSVLYGATRRVGVISSTDGGATWLTSAGGLPTVELFSIAIDRSNPTRIWTGADGSGVFRKADGTAMWALSSAGMLRANAQALAVHPTDSAQVLSAIDGGNLFRSQDGGADWAESRNGLNSRRVLALAYDPTNASRVYAGSSNPLVTGDGAFYRSADGGQTWESRFTGLGVFAAKVARSNGRVYAGTFSGIVRSNDGGDTFEDASGRQGELANTAVVDLAVDPVDPDRVFAAASTTFGQAASFIVRTTNGGRDWQSAGATALQLRAIVQDLQSRDRIYVGGDGGMFVSTDGGQVFQTSNTGLPDPATLSVVDVVVSPGGGVYAATTQGVFKSTDRGATWTAADRGLETTIVRQLAADPNNGGVVYAATAGQGVFKTTDGGARWQPTGLGEQLLPRLEPGGIVNAADFLGGGIAPGEIISLFGQRFGPETGVSTGFGGDGKLPTLESGVQVLIDGVAAPLFFVREDQINAVVPNAVAGRDEAEVQVLFNGVGSNKATVPVLAAHPALFTAVLNLDGSVNSESNPQPAGGAVMLFGTGQGLTVPSVATGAPAPSAEPLARPELPVEVEFAGQIVQPLFAGLAPGFVGLLQVNLPVPSDFGAGNLPARISVGGVQAPRPINVFVGPAAAAATE